MPPPAARNKLRSQIEFQHLWAMPVWRHRAELEQDLAGSFHGESEFEVSGYSESASRRVSFRVTRPDGTTLPNWRETLVCPETGLNNRMRAVVCLLNEWLESPSERVHRGYVMEQITPFYRWIHSHNRLEITGSEWLGVDVPSGTVHGGIRHEDVHALSFPNEAFDVVITQDVMEHVPDPWRGFSELARVLRPGGRLLMTIPFYAANADSRARSRIEDGRIVHILPAEYHGNPLADRNGSLVFTDFGWDVLPRLIQCGFRDAWIEVFWSFERAHLGMMQLLFVAER